MSASANLFKLQRIDLELDTHHNRWAEIEMLLESDEEVRRTKKQQESAQAATAEARRAQGIVRAEIDQVNAKRQTSEQRLYSGNVKNPKELQDLQNEVEALGRRIEILEENEFEALIVLEDAETDEAEATKALREATANWNSTQADLIQEKGDREREAARLEIEREATVIPVNAASREVYGKLRAAKGGVAVARIEDSTCTACGMAPSSSRLQKARNSTEIVFCGNCGRILYAD